MSAGREIGREDGQRKEKVYGTSHLVGCMKHLLCVIEMINIFMVQIKKNLHQSKALT